MGTMTAEHLSPPDHLFKSLNIDFSCLQASKLEIWHLQTFIPNSHSLWLPDNFSLLTCDMFILNTLFNTYFLEELCL